MRILAFSDWRVQNVDDVFTFLNSLEKPVDVILYGGDDVSRFKVGNTNYFTRLASHTVRKKVLAVMGNDDYPSTRSVLQGEDIHDLHKEPFVIDEFGFIGLEGSTIGPGVISYSESSVRSHLNRQLKKIKPKKLIIVSHPPPYGVLDRGTRHATKREGTRHIGSKALRSFIRKNAVELVVCGHCHLGGGHSDSLGETVVANVSSHDHEGAPGNLALIEFDPEFRPHIRWANTRQFVDPDSLERLHGIKQKRAFRFKEAGIKTIPQLAKAKKLEQISRMTKLSKDFVEKAKLNAISVTENRTLRTLETSLPQNNVMFFDIETDLSQRRIWLIGVLHDGTFTQFFAKDWKQEKSMLTDFLEFLREKQMATLVSYSGLNFDQRVVCEALRRNRLDWKFFSSIPHIDLCQSIKDSFIFPIQKYALKDLGKHLGYKFKHPDMDGLHVALEYLSHLKEKRKLDSSVFEYNKDDVNVLPYLIKKLEHV